MQKSEQQEIYQILLYRKDQQLPMEIMSSPNWKEVEERWETLYNSWETSHKESKPFVLREPVVTAFEPGLISEISITPKYDVINTVDDGNPYKRSMQQHGLSQAFQGVPQDYRQQVQTSDILDRGMK